MKRAALFLAIALAGCGPSVKSVTVEPQAAVLDAKGATTVLKATPLDEKGRAVEGSKAKVTWTSSAPQVAGVDEAGTVTALHSGAAVVSAQAGEVKGAANVVVSIPAAVTVTPAAGELRPGEALALAVVVADDDGKAIVAPRGLSWTSSDPAIATVVEGKVTAAGPGTATVTASYKGLRGTSQVTVKVPSFARLTLNPAKAQTLKRGDTLRVKGAALDKAGTPVSGVALAWRSSDASVVSVAADGTMKALKKGTATVTATAYGKSAAVKVKVVDAPAKGGAKAKPKKKK
jgi:uncharacterized protein YjdB